MRELHLLYRHKTDSSPDKLTITTETEYFLVHEDGTEEPVTIKLVNADLYRY